MTQVEATYAVVPNERQLEVKQETLSLDDLPPHAVALEAEATVISAGTELAIYTAAVPSVHVPGNWNSYPYRPGYGLVGHVLAVGESVSRVEADDRVFCFGKHASRQIYRMSSDKPMVGIFPLGAETADLTTEELAMLRMALVALSGPQVTDLHPASTVAVFGLGVVGNLAAQLYRCAGLRVIGLDPVSSRCQRARDVGIDAVSDAPPDAQLDAVRDLTDGRGADIVVDAVGHSAVTLTCVHACADYGQVILLGSPRAPVSGDLTPVFRETHLRWLTIRGALEWRLPPYPVNGVRDSIQTNLDYLIRLVREGHLNLKDVVSHMIKPQDLRQAYEGLLNQKHEYFGVVVDWRA